LGVDHFYGICNLLRCIARKPIKVVVFTGEYSGPT